jgi:hypothetical protein
MYLHVELEARKEKDAYEISRKLLVDEHKLFVVRDSILQLQNTIIVDKIVGKAAALLISYIQAQTVFCSLLSIRGKTVLKNHGITFFHEELTPEIINRYGTDICPFEKAVLDVEDPKIGYLRIQAKLQQLGLLDPEL